MDSTAKGKWWWKSSLQRDANTLAYSTSLQIQRKSCKNIFSLFCSKNTNTCVNDIDTPRHLRWVTSNTIPFVLGGHPLAQQWRMGCIISLNGWNSNTNNKAVGWPYAQCKCMSMPFNVSITLNVSLLGIEALVLIKHMLYLQVLTLDEHVEMPLSAILPRWSKTNSSNNFYTK